MEAAQISSEFLDDLVARSDAAGGAGTPDAQAVWASTTAVVAPEDLASFEGVDPFSEAYGDLQLELWSRWTGREYDPRSSELTEFEFANHLEARTAYGTRIMPLTLAQHYVAVTRAVSALGVEGGRILEVGAGWGLQAELLSELGFQVDVVDVNPAFVRLIGERLDRRGFGGLRLVGTFDDFTVPEGRYELAYTYEALHHSPQPASTVRRFVGEHGAAARRLAFVGEPVVDMWPAWGLRTDPESLYCIRKFGWFESGWSADFILSCIARTGLGALLLRPLTSDRDGVVIGAPVAPLDPTDRASWSPFVAGWLAGPEGLTSTGESALAFSVNDSARIVVLDLGWYNPRPTTLALTLFCGDVIQHSTVIMHPGLTEHVMDLPSGVARVVSIQVDGETWCPRAVQGVADRRRISIEVIGLRTEDARRPEPDPEPEPEPERVLPSRLSLAPRPLLASMYRRARRRPEPPM